MSYRAPFSAPSRGRGSKTNARWYPPGSARLVPPEVVPIAFTKGLGEGIAEIKAPEDLTGHPDAAIENVVPVASYDWGSGETPTIVVPSSPPIWNPRQVPFQCKVDSGFRWINQDAFRCPTSPLIPLIEAVQCCSPQFDFSAIDIVTNRNNLRKLISWAQDNAEDFRIDLQRAGLSTVLFTRWQPVAGEPAQRSYATEFGNFMTRSKELGSRDHNRIVTYDFAELNLLVRFGVDACYPSKLAPDLDGLMTRTESLSLSSETETSSSYVSRSGLQIVPSREKSLADQRDLIELATRSYRSRENFNWLVKYPQLYLSDTPSFVLGVHDRGMFTEVETFRTDDMSDTEVRKAREEIQPGLNKLAAVLRIIHAKVLELTDDDVTGSRRNRLMSLVCENGKLHMYERAEGPKLPPPLVACFD